MFRATLFFLLITWLFTDSSLAATFVFINQNAAPADAFEHFVSSTPYADQTLAKAPDSVVITFSRPINPDKSSIKVYDMYGAEKTGGKTTVNGVAMTASLPPLPPGRYAVKWLARCLCDDANNMRDEFHFTVR